MASPRYKQGVAVCSSGKMSVALRPMCQIVLRSFSLVAALASVPSREMIMSQTYRAPVEALFYRRGEQRPSKTGGASLTYETIGVLFRRIMAPKDEDSLLVP